MSKSSELSMSVLFIFKIQETNGALFFNVNSLSYASLSRSGNSNRSF